MSGRTRVVLIEPGDVLLIGNLGRLESPEQIEPVVRCLDELGIASLVFSADIDLDSITSEQVAVLAQRVVKS